MSKETTGGILSGHEIKRALRLGEIDIDPFNVEQVNSASVDLHLGDDICVYTPAGFDAEQVEFVLYNGVLPVAEIDTKKPALTHHVKLKPEGLWLQPNSLYLMHTVERIHTKSYVPVLDGKSSVGRTGTAVHITAGYGDPGFNGQYTLEVVTFHRVKLYPGMRICQMRFHTLVGDPIDYAREGHYVGEAAKGAVPSMIHKQFEK